MQIQRRQDLVLRLDLAALQGVKTELALMFIQGRRVRFIHIPKSVNVSDAVEAQVCFIFPRLFDCSNYSSIPSQLDTKSPLDQSTFFPSLAIDLSWAFVERGQFC